MPDRTTQTQHSNPSVPTTGDGLLVRLSGETVQLVRKATHGGYGNAFDLDALDAVQRDIDAAERANDRRLCCTSCGYQFQSDDTHHYCRAPSDSTTRDGTADDALGVLDPANWDK